MPSRKLRQSAPTASSQSRHASLHQARLAAGKPLDVWTGLESIVFSETLFVGLLVMVGARLNDDLRARYRILSDEIDRLLASACDSLALPRPKALVLDEVIGIVVRGFEAAGAADRIRLSLPDRPIRIVADQGMAMAILRNLIENALKYSPPELVVTLACRTRRCAPRSENVGPKSCARPHLYLRNARNLVRSQKIRAGHRSANKEQTLSVMPFFN